jgi:ArsR family transcriptional regulator, arsenate/arsenite/antimonite-responsive transcriptional repressor
VENLDIGAVDYFSFPPLTTLAVAVIICIMAQMRKPAKKVASPPAPCCAGLTPFLDPRLFKALSDRTRVEILARLASGCAARSVSEVAAGMPVDLSVVSRHLAQLREAGIVTSCRRGKEVSYSVLYPELVRTLRDLADALERCCPDGPPGPGQNPGPRKNPSSSRPTRK